MIVRCQDPSTADPDNESPLMDGDSPAILGDDSAINGNLYADLTGAAEERFDTLLVRPGLRIERIVSTGQASPPGFWYEQESAEWVVLLSGAALFRFADEPDARRLAAGDWIHIAAGRRHRVEWTQATPPSVWLAVHHQQSLG